MWRGFIGLLCCLPGTVVAQSTPTSTATAPPRPTSTATAAAATGTATPTATATATATATKPKAKATSPAKSTATAKKPVATATALTPAADQERQTAEDVRQAHAYLTKLWAYKWFLFFAFFIGCIGAGAYCTGVYLGLIEKSRRKDNLRFMLLLHEQTERLVVPTHRWGMPWSMWVALRLVVLYIFLGGLIAMVFQWPQLDAFAPIQALVMGATWPLVLMRASSSGNNADVGNVGNADPTRNVPATPRAATDAEV